MGLNKKIAPSLMCADIYQMEETIKRLERCKVDYLHLDIMDGTFVPNLMLGTSFCKQLKSKTALPLDIHLMIKDAEQKLLWFDFAKGDMVSIHIEAFDSAPAVKNALGAIRSRGARPALAIVPDTRFAAVIPYLDQVDAILIMTVNPGFSGQRLVPFTLEKLRQARNYLDEHGYERVEIEVDGNVSFFYAGQMSRMGADIFVAGSSSVFAGDQLEANIAKLKAAIMGGRE